MKLGRQISRKMAASTMGESRVVGRVMSGPCPLLCILGTNIVLIMRRAKREAFFSWFSKEKKAS